MANTQELLRQRKGLVDEAKAIDAADELSAEDEGKLGEIRSRVDDLDKRIERAAWVDAVDKQTAEAQSVQTSETRAWNEVLGEYSLMNVLRAMTENGKLAGAEAEADSEVRSRNPGRDYKGFAVPTELLLGETRAASDITTAKPSGGPPTNIMQTQLRTDLMPMLYRDALVVEQAGATVVRGLTSSIEIPQQSATAEGTWLAEDGAASDDTLEFSKSSTLSPKTAAVYVQIGRRIIQQAIPDLEALVRADFSASIARTVDKALLNGAVSGNDPVGLLNISGIVTDAAATNGGVLTRNDLLRAVQNFAVANVPMGAMTAVTTPEVLTRASVTLSEASSVAINRYLADSAMSGAMMLGMRTLTTNALPKDLTKNSGTNLHPMVFGDWSEVIVGYWSGIDLMTNPFDGDAFRRGAVMVRAMVDVNSIVRRPESLRKFVDISPTLPS